jgi:hypothetical protein
VKLAKALGIDCTASTKAEDLAAPEKSAPKKRKIRRSKPPCCPRCTLMEDEPLANEQFDPNLFLFPDPSVVHRTVPAPGRSAGDRLRSLQLDHHAGRRQNWHWRRGVHRLGSGEWEKPDVVTLKAIMLESVEDLDSLLVSLMMWGETHIGFDQEMDCARRSCP